jgi:hypothetical protein
MSEFIQHVTDEFVSETVSETMTEGSENTDDVPQECGITQMLQHANIMSANSMVELCRQVVSLRLDQLIRNPNNSALMSEFIRILYDIKTLTEERNKLYDQNFTQADLYTPTLENIKRDFRVFSLIKEQTREVCINAINVNPLVFS